MINFWKGHGTKILGGVITILGLVVTATPDQLQSVFGQHAAGAAETIGGILTILRGFTNTNNLNGGGK